MHIYDASNEWLGFWNQKPKKAFGENVLTITFDMIQNYNLRSHLIETKAVCDMKVVPPQSSC